MLCAHTVRRLKPGTLEQFEEAFRPDEDDFPPGLVRFHLLRGLHDENEIVTFGFFDGTLEELERTQAEGDYEARRAAIEPYVEAVIANGVYEIKESWTREGAPAQER
jgi:heme-degrading monooxygenase HmoA